MAIWTPEQKTKTRKLKAEGCRQVLEVEIPAPKAADAIQTAVVRIQLNAKIPGFRPGRAPIDQVKAQFLPRARAQAADELIEAAVREALKDQNIHPVAMPSVDNVRFPEGGALTFELHIETAPEFTAKGYKGLALTKKTAAAGDADVADRLKQLQEGNARLEAADEPVGKDHYVVIDFSLTRDGKPLPNGSGKAELVDMSSDQTVDGLVEGLQGAKKAETREFDVKLEGKPARCKATVQEVKRKSLPGLDDEFAKDLGVESLAALKEKLKEIAQRELDARAERELQSQVDKALLDANKFEAPPSLVEQQLEHMFARLSERLMGPAGALPEADAKKLREKLAPEAENAVRLQFVVARIAEAEKVEISDADLSAELEKSLAQAETDKDKTRTREVFGSRKEEIAAMLRERKVYALVREAAKIKEEKA